MIVFLVQVTLFSFKQTRFMDFHYFDWYTIMLPTIFICVFYTTVILGNLYVFIRDGEKKFKTKLKLNNTALPGPKSGKNLSSRSVAGTSTLSQSSRQQTEELNKEKMAKRSKFLRFAIFMSEYLFVVLVILICVRYSNYELKMDSSTRLKLASVLIFSANIALHVYCFIFTVVKPLIEFKKVYDGDEKTIEGDLKF